MELCATKNHLPTCPSCYPTGYCQRRRASHPPSPIANRCGWPVPSEPPFLLLDASCPMMMMPSATNATTTTTTASYSGDSYSTLPLLLPPPHKQSPFLQKPMPSPDRCLPTEIPRGRKTRDDGEKTRYQKKKKEQGKRRCAVCGDQQDQPRRHPSPNNKRQQQLVYPHAIFPEAPKTPARVGRERSRKGPGDDAAIPACSVRPPLQLAKSQSGEQERAAAGKGSATSTWGTIYAIQKKEPVSQMCRRRHYFPSWLS